MRVLWAIFGALALMLGIIGIALPLLPTVPFLLLAAFCFARSSVRLHSWLVDHPRLGPPIADWRNRGAIGRSAKKAATISIVAAFLISVMLGIGPLLLVLQAVVLLIVLGFIWSRPEG